MSEWQEIPDLHIWGCRVALDTECFADSVNREEWAEVVSGAMKQFLLDHDELVQERGALFIEGLEGAHLR